MIPFLSVESEEMRCPKCSRSTPVNVEELEELVKILSVVAGLRSRSRPLALTCPAPCHGLIPLPDSIIRVYEQAWKET